MLLHSIQLRFSHSYSLAFAASIASIASVASYAFAASTTSHSGSSPSQQHQQFSGFIVLYIPMPLSIRFCILTSSLASSLPASASSPLACLSL